MASLAWFFPVTLPVERRWPWLKYLFFGPMVGMVTAMATIPYLSYADSMGKAGILDWLVTVGLFFFLLRWRAGAVKDPDQRRRIRTILQGSSLALTPLLLVLLAQLFLSVESELGLAMGIVMIAGLPFTLGCVVLVQRAFGVGVVIRQGLQYALAQRAMRLVQIAVSVGIVLIVVRLAQDPKQTHRKLFNWWWAG